MLTKDYSIFNNKTAVCAWCQGSVQGIELGTCSCYLGLQAVQSRWSWGPRLGMAINQGRIPKGETENPELYSGSWLILGF